MSEYYAVQRSDDFLAHYGVKGMKWGVKKAIQKGSDRALRRQYKKAAKKLAKLEKRGANGKKYAKRAAAYGLGAAAAGGLAVAGTGGVSRLIRGAGSAGAHATRATGNALSRLGEAAFTYGRTPGGRTGKIKKMATRYGKAAQRAGEAISGSAHGISKGARGVATSVTRWGNQTHNISKSVQKGLGAVGLKNAGTAARSNMLGRGLGKATVSNNTLARIGAAGVGAGLGIAAGRNAYKAATAKRNRVKAAQFRSEMNKAFAGTKYANGIPRQGRKKRRR